MPGRDAVSSRRALGGSREKENNNRGRRTSGYCAQVLVSKPKKLWTTFASRRDTFRRGAVRRKPPSRHPSSPTHTHTHYTATLPVDDSRDAALGVGHRSDDDALRSSVVVLAVES